MTLPYNDPADISYPTPYFQDNTFVRGDYMRSNNQKIWANLEYLRAFEPKADISGGNVHDATRRGPYHGIGVTNEPADKYFWATDYVTPMITGRYYLASSVVSGKIYAIGGTTGSASNSNEEYNPATNSWSTKAVMTTARYELSSSVVSGKIYAIGGTTGANFLTTNEAYDPVANSWTTKAAMTTGRYGLITEEVDGIIYAIGGYKTGTTLSNENEAYNPVNNSWSTKAAMTTARNGCASAVLNGIIYVIGGTSGSATFETKVEAYDPVANSWTTKGSLNNGRLNPSACSIGGKIYVFSGQGTSGFDTVEEYDPNTNAWTVIGTMPHLKFRISPSIPVIQNKAYLVGGMTALDIPTSAPYMSVVYDWNYEYIQKNASTLQVIATDAYGSWRGSAEKVANNIDTTAVWGGWLYTNKNALQWYDLTLLNGWITSGNNIFKISKDSNGYVQVVSDNINGTGATSTTVCNIPVGYRPLYRQNVTACNTSASAVWRVYIEPNGDVIVSATAVASYFFKFYYKAEQ